VSTLRAESIQKRFKRREVVKGISLVVGSGEIVGLLGPNGAGKTTAFYMIVGLIPCDAGRITLDEHDLTGMPMHRRARLGLGYLPQEASVFRKLSVEDNILAILQTRPDLDRTAQERLLEELLEELRIAHVRTSMGVSLSGGERRRVEIARALAAEPRFVLLDEPFAGIDPVTIEGITFNVEAYEHVFTERLTLADGSERDVARHVVDPRHVAGADLVAGDRHHAVRGAPRDMLAGHADVHGADLGTRHLYQFILRDQSDRHQDRIALDLKPF
jgi:lipopolysaccharide export system ATP-binding protein